MSIEYVWVIGPKGRTWTKLFCHLLLPALFFLTAGGTFGRAAVRAASSPTDLEWANEDRDAPVENVRKEMGALGPGQTIRQEINGGETHVYRVTLSQGQFVQVLVAELEVDVEPAIVAPDGSSLSMDSPRRFQGFDSVSAVTAAAGVYSIEIAADPSVPSGHYEIHLEGLRSPTPADRQRVAAEQAFRDARLLAATPDLALPKFQIALDQWTAVGDTRWIAYTLCWIGREHKSLGHLPESVQAFDQALAWLENAQDKSGQAFILNEKARAISKLDDPINAESSLRAALELRLQAGDKLGAAQILDNLGQNYMDSGFPQKAADAYNSAVPLWHDAGDLYWAANTQCNLAGAQDQLGDSATALENLDQVLHYCQTSQICGQSGDGNLEIMAHNNRGNIYAARSDAENAFGELRQGLTLARYLHKPASEALLLSNIGMTYADFGDYQQALDNLQASLAIYLTIHSPREQALVYNDLGHVYEVMGNFAESGKYLDLALPLAQQTGVGRLAAYTLTNLGMLNVLTGRLQQGLEVYQQALKLQQNLDDRHGQAVTFNKMGEVYRQLGDAVQAEKYFDLALRDWEYSGDRHGQALTLYNVASLARERGDLFTARDQIDSALRIIESLRGSLSSDQLRRTYFSTKQDYYALDIDVRMQLYQQTGDIADRDAALAASERARARNLLDLLRDAQVNLTPENNPQLAERERQLQVEINAANESSMWLRELKRPDDAAIAEKRLRELTREYDGVLAQIRVTRPGYSGLKQPQPLTVSEIQALLDPDSLLLEYSLGDQHSYVWAVTRTGIAGYALPGRPEIEKAAGRLDESLTATGTSRPGENASSLALRQLRSRTELRQQALAMSEMILRPVAAQVREAKRLVIVADGGLHFIPFEVLPLPLSTSTNGRRRAASPGGGRDLVNFLTLTKEIVYQPSISALALLRATSRPIAPKMVAVLADPVFDVTDARVRTDAAHRPAAAPPDPVGDGALASTLRDFGAEPLAPLRYSGQEATDIVATAPPGQSLKIVGFSANLARAMSPDLAQYRTVHFATHAFLNSSHPELSGIVLSLVDEQGHAQPGFMNLYDIYRLHLPVELVVLSGCQTGIGPEVRGEGLIGLTRGFMYAGAARVIASLWKVSDEATAVFMRHFYQHLQGEGLSASAALRAARLDMMRERAEWRAPFYWAGFVLQGEWK